MNCSNARYSIAIYAHTVAVMRLHFSKKNNPLLNYASQSHITPTPLRSCCFVCIFRRYLAEILPIRRKTISNQSIVRISYFLSISFVNQINPETHRYYRIIYRYRRQSINLENRPGSRSPKTKCTTGTTFFSQLFKSLLQFLLENKSGPNHFSFNDRKESIRGMN